MAVGVGLTLGCPEPGVSLSLAQTTGHAARFTLATVVDINLTSSSWEWVPTVWFIRDPQRAYP